MIIYKCECCYETHKKDTMRNHLNRKNSCIPGKDMKTVDINTLVIGEKKPYEDLTLLSKEEKLERHKKQKRKAMTKQNMLGKKNLENFAKNILHQIKSRTKQRKHQEISWILDDIIKILENNKIYMVHNTILGDLEFPMMLTNGYHNTASFDRINDNLGYLEENIEIRPCFLNNYYKITTENIKEIIEIREQKQSYEELLNISQIINDYDSYNFFYKLAHHARSNSKNCKKEKTFNFENIEKCALFLIRKFIEQGGRCVYSKISIYPIKKHKYRVSIERLDPTKNYSEDNIILIVIGLNSQPYGQFKNKDVSEKDRNIALNAGKFNQEYWNQCTKMTSEIIKNCEEAKEYDKMILLENLSDEMKSKIL